MVSREPLVDLGSPYGRRQAAPPAVLQWGLVYRSRPVWHLGLVYVAFGFSYMIYLTFFFKRLVAEGGYSKAAAGDLFMTLGWASLVCGVLWGWLSDRLGRRVALVSIYLVQSLAYGLFALWPTPTGFTLSALLFGITAWSIPAVMAAACGDVLGPRLAPAALGFITLFFGMVYTQGYVVLPLDMASHGLNPAQYGLAIAVNGFLIILTTIPVSNMAARWPRFPTMALAAVFLGLGFGFTALASTLPLFVLSVAIWTLGEIAGTSVAPTVIADLSPIELRGLYQGIFGASWGLAFFIGPLLGGWVYQHMGAQALWLGCLVIGLGLSLAYLALGRLAAAHRPSSAALISRD